MSVGSFDAEVIAVEARRHLEPDLAPVIPIDAALRTKRALPDISDYDDLLENN
jgi:hypothetical protein